MAITLKKTPNIPKVIHASELGKFMPEINSLLSLGANCAKEKDCNCGICPYASHGCNNAMLEDMSSLIATLCACIENMGKANEWYKDSAKAIMLFVEGLSPTYCDDQKTKDIYSLLATAKRYHEQRVTALEEAQDAYHLTADGRLLGKKALFAEADHKRDVQVPVYDEEQAKDICGVILTIPESEITPEMLARHRYKVKAIKLYRTKHDVSLKEAADAIEAIMNAN